MIQLLTLLSLSLTVPCSSSVASGTGTDAETDAARPNTAGQYDDILDMCYSYLESNQCEGRLMYMHFVIIIVKTIRIIINFIQSFSLNIIFIQSFFHVHPFIYLFVFWFQVKNGVCLFTSTARHRRNTPQTR